MIELGGIDVYFGSILIGNFNQLGCYCCWCCWILIFRVSKYIDEKKVIIIIIFIGKFV